MGFRSCLGKYEVRRPETPMSRLLVSWFSLSLDGYGAGPRQSREDPLGVGGEALHDWIVRTRTFKSGKGGETGIDDDIAAREKGDMGAWILGRNMFGPVRGPWPDDSWRGWWGKNPPYHVPVFVLTHHARQPLEMEGGTVFHFVTDGIEAALERARAASGGKDKSRGTGFLPGYLGVNITGLAENEIRAELSIQPHHIAPNGYLHAGRTIALFRCTQLVLYPTSRVEATP